MERKTMSELMTATALEQVRIITPYVFSALVFALFTWLMCYITEIRINRRWLRDPANMERTVQDHLKRKDDIIKEVEKERDELKAENVKMAAVIRGIQSRVLIEGRPVIGRKAG
jgi:p-aminobenzoyl-glutamate transporter AbgT